MSDRKGFWLVVAGVILITFGCGLGIGAGAELPKNDLTAPAVIAAYLFDISGLTSFIAGFYVGPEIAAERRD